MYIRNRKRELIAKNTDEVLDLIMSMPKLLNQYYNKAKINLSDVEKYELDREITLLIIYIKDFRREELTPGEVREILRLTEKYFGEGWRIYTGTYETNQMQGARRRGVKNENSK